MPTRKVIKTVMCVDLARYSDVAVALEENLGSELVKGLNDHILGLIERGVAAAGGSRAENLVKTTGDGAILVFDAADQAHVCAERIHQSAEEANLAKTNPSAKRYFRMGAGSAEVNLDVDDETQALEDVHGMAVIRAARLQAIAKPGELVVDTLTFDKLAAGNRSAYGDVEKVRGKRGEVFRARRVQLVSDVDPAFLEQSKRLRNVMEFFLAHFWLTVVGASAAILFVALVGYAVWRTTQVMPAGPLPATPLMILEAMQLHDSGVEEQWYVEQLKQAEAAWMKDPDKAHAAVFESKPLAYSQSVLVAQAELYHRDDDLTVHAWLFRGPWARHLTTLEAGAAVPELETPIIGHRKAIRLRIQDVQKGDELRVIVVAIGKDLPEPTALQFQVMR
jgi:class 3 adenylate cyclase